jgi:Ca2+-binding EF-hand superfamily protein
LYDTNKNGAIELEQFAVILKSLEVETDDEKIKVIVTKVDKNRDGQVDFDEFVNAMTSLITQNGEITAEPEDIDTLRKWKTYPDPDSKHRKTRSEDTTKREHYTRRMSRHETDELKQLFGKFDKNGDGQISVDELKEVMAGLGEKLTDLELQDMMKDADENKDGFIDFSEFKALMPGSSKK